MGTTENVQAWSKTAATNSAADAGINWAEGQDPASVNNSARGMMAALKKYAEDVGGALVAGGTANALTVTTKQVLSSGHVADGLTLQIEAASDNTSATVTFSPDGLTAANVKRADGSALAVGSIKAGMRLFLCYDAGASEWRCANIAPLPAGGSTPAAVASFSANKNSVSQSITSGSFQKLTFTTEEFDVGGFYDNTNSKWTPPVGTVMIVAAAQVRSMPDRAVAEVVLYKNGSIYRFGTQLHSSTASTTDMVATGSWIAQANGTDYFEIYCFQNSGGSLNADGAVSLTYFSGSML